MRHILAVSVFLSAWTHATAARAFAPGADDSQTSVPRPSADVALTPAHKSAFVGASSDVEDDGTVTFLGQVYLGIPQSANPSSEAVSGIIESYFKSMVGDANIELNLLTSDGDEEGGSRYAFVQAVHGVPVLGTYALARVQDGAVNFSRQFLVRTPRLNTKPTVSVSVAEGAAITDILSFAGAAIVDKDAGPAALHVLYVEATPYLVWEVTVKSQDPYGSYHVYVDAQRGGVLSRVKASLDSVSGEVTGNIEPMCQGDAPVAVSLPHLEMSDGLTTNSDGTFVSELTPAKVKVSLSGPYFKIISHARDAWTWDSPLQAHPMFNEVTLEEAPLAQIDAYYYVHQARGWLVDRLNAASTFSRSRAVTWANRQLPVHVNLPNGHHGMSCNAFYDGSSLNFYVAEPRYGCNNSSRAAKIVFHEYGHGVHDHLTASRNTFDSQVSEGVADYIAASITNDPNITGLVGCTKPLRGRTTVRTCNNQYSYCRSKKCNSGPSDEVHNAAPVICGALWDLRGELKERYGAAEGVNRADKFFLRFLTLVTDMNSSYAAAIAADDDDDNDPSNGTTHSCEINRAFFADGLDKKAHFPGAMKQRVPCVAQTEQ